jgi:predicted unusual protein kinase regulating ubiquinone biosynthesis (AarF/ABC1/UbiB family)
MYFAIGAMMCLLQALPGTRLYARMENEGRLISEGSGDNVDGSTNIIPKMDIDLLRQGYRNMLRRIYSPKLYYERIITFLRECEPPRLHIRLDPQNLLALRTRALLEGLAVDTAPQTSALSSGDRAGDLWLSLSPGVRSTRLAKASTDKRRILNLVAIKTEKTKPKRLSKEQRTYIRRLKQVARKAGIAYVPPSRAPRPEELSKKEEQA